MNRRLFFKKLGIGTAVVIANPTKLLNELPTYGISPIQIFSHTYISEEMLLDSKVDLLSIIQHELASSMMKDLKKKWI